MPQHSYATVPFISVADSEGRTNLINSRFVEFVYTLQFESARTGISFVPVAVNESNWKKSLGHLAQQRSTVGYIFWANGFSVAMVNEAVEWVVALGQSAVIAIIDEIGDFSVSRPFDANARVKVFTIAGESAGKTVARYLLGNAHRNIAYFSAYHAEHWSRFRLKGLVHYYQPSDSAPAPGPTGLSISSYVYHENYDAVELEPRALDLLNSYSDSFDKVISNLRSARLIWLNVLPYHNLRNEKVFRIATDLFGQALLRGTATAWIAVNDVIAVLARDFLLSNEIKVPAEISVVGLDDTNLSFQHDLTGYNFAFSSMAKLVISFILNPTHRYFAGRSVVEFEGLIIERGSSGKASPA
jgi:DNA-binding LacI/PurR family transcriptional regulator